MTNTNHGAGTMKWSELEKQGVRRCCATFMSGKRCRRHSANQKRGGFCVRCDEQIERRLAPHRAIVAAEADGSLYDNRETDDE